MNQKISEVHTFHTLILAVASPQGICIILRFAPSACGLRGGDRKHREAALRQWLLLAS